MKTLVFSVHASMPEGFFFFFESKKLLDGAVILQAH